MVGFVSVLNHTARKETSTKAWIYPCGFGLSRGDPVAGYSVHKGPLFLLA